MPPFGVAYFSLRSLHHNNFRKFCKPDLQHENAAKQIYEKELSVRQTEKLVKAINAEKDKAQKEDKQERISLKPSYFSEVELALTEYLGKKVTVTGSKNNEGGVLQIEFYSKDELKELANKLH